MQGEQYVIVFAHESELLANHVLAVDLDQNKRHLSAVLIEDVGCVAAIDNFVGEYDFVYYYRNSYCYVFAVVIDKMKNPMAENYSNNYCRNKTAECSTMNPLMEPKSIKK